MSARSMLTIGKSVLIHPLINDEWEKAQTKGFIAKLQLFQSFDWLKLSHQKVHWFNLKCQNFMLC